MSRTISYHFVVFILALLLSIPLITACAPAQKILASQACQSAHLHLKRKVGPEFGKLIQSLPLPLDEQTYGCALRFTRIAEELPGEIQGSYRTERASEELAIMLKDSQNRSILNVMRVPPYRNVSVKLTLKLQDIQIGKALELIVLEKPQGFANNYRALRIFNFAKGVPIARELFSQQLLIKTPEGIKVNSSWKLEKLEGRLAIVLKGGGEYRVFMWHDGTQRFKLDLAASQRRKRKTFPSRIFPRSKRSKVKANTKTKKYTPPPPKKKTAEPNDNSSSKKSIKDLVNDL